MGAIFMIVIWIWAFYMTRSNCSNMTPVCLIFLGIFAFMQCLFELIPLIMSLSGRNITHTVVEQHALEDGTTQITQ